MLIAQRSQSRHERGRRHDVATFAQHWLDDEGRDVLRRNAGVKHLVDRPEHVIERCLIAGPGRVSIRVRIRHVVHARQEGLIAFAVVTLRCGQREGPIGAAVKGTLESDQRRASRRVAGQLDRPLDRLRATVREENLVELARCQRRDALGKLDRGLVMRDHRGMHHLVELRLCRRDDLGMTVAEVGDRDARGEIQVAAAVDAVEVGTLGVIDDDRCVAVQDLGEMGAFARQPLFLAIVGGLFFDESHVASLIQRPSRDLARARPPVEAARQSRPTRCTKCDSSSCFLP